MTTDEARHDIIKAARFSAWWWATQVGEEKTPAERCSGAIFTFLAELDGVGFLFPCDVVVLETDDEGLTIAEHRVSEMLHEYLYADGWRASEGPV